MRNDVILQEAIKRERKHKTIQNNCYNCLYLCKDKHLYCIKNMSLIAILNACIIQLTLYYYNDIYVNF